MSISVIPPHHVTEDNGTAHSSIPSISSLLRALLNSAEKIMALRPPRIGKFTATDWPDVGCALCCALVKTCERCKVDICLPQTFSLVIHHTTPQYLNISRNICHSNSLTDPAENRKPRLVRNFIIIFLSPHPSLNIMPILGEISFY